MDLILPAEISGKIMTLIDQAREKLIIVSPYNKVRYWKKLKQRIEKAKSRGVDIKWYIRSNVEHNASQIRELGIEPIEIDNLHCKIYLNENQAVVPSMNLHEASDNSSIDIGYFVKEKDKHSELVDFIATYLDTENLETSKPTTKTKNDKNEFKQDKSVFSYNKKYSFYENLVNYLSCYSKFYNKIEFYHSKYGKLISLQNFLSSFDLIFEPKGSYYRIDLRINKPYKERSTIFDFLLELRDNLEKEIKYPINYGNQMKRLKIDLEIFDNNNYENWSINEFQILKPYIDRTIQTLDRELNKRNF